MFRFLRRWFAGHEWEARLPMLASAGRRPAPSAAVIPVIRDYSTADFFGDDDGDWAPWATWPSWLFRGFWRRARPLSPEVERAQLVSLLLPQPAPPVADVDERGAAAAGSANAALYRRWAAKCRAACVAVTITAPRRQGAPIAYYEPRTLTAGELESWTERAWQVALGVERGAHLEPIFLPERLQVGFCCSSGGLAAELQLLILAENVEARLGNVRHESEDGRDPCDILLPVRPDASVEELDRVVHATASAAHTVLCTWAGVAA